MNPRRVLAGLALLPLALLLLLAADAAGQQIPRGPILIEDDLDFLLPSNGVRSGSGTADDPYIISDWRIEPVIPPSLYGSNSDPNPAIKIAGVTSQFRLQDISISDRFQDEPAIVIQDVGSFEIDNVHITDPESSIQRFTIQDFNESKIANFHVDSGTRGSIAGGKSIAIHDLALTDVLDIHRGWFVDFADIDSVELEGGIHGEGCLGLTLNSIGNITIQDLIIPPCHDDPFTITNSGAVTAKRVGMDNGDGPRPWSIFEVQNVESVSIHSPLNLSTQRGYYAFIDGSKRVEVQDFDYPAQTVDGVGGWTALELRNPGSVDLRGLRLSGAGVYVRGCDSLHVEGLTIRRAAEPLDIRSCGNVTLHDATVGGSLGAPIRRGMSIEGAAIDMKNIIIDHADFAVLAGGSSVDLRGLHVTDSGRALTIDATEGGVTIEDVYVHGGEINDVRGNTFIHATNITIEDARHVLNLGADSVTARQIRILNATDFPFSASGNEVRLHDSVIVGEHAANFDTAPTLPSYLEITNSTFIGRDMASSEPEFVRGAIHITSVQDRIDPPSTPKDGTILLRGNHIESHYGTALTIQAPRHLAEVTDNAFIAHRGYGLHIRNNPYTIDLSKGDNLSGFHIPQPFGTLILHGNTWDTAKAPTLFQVEPDILIDDPLATPPPTPTATGTQEAPSAPLLVALLVMVAAAILKVSRVQDMEWMGA